jgi:hypothetical protein
MFEIKTFINNPLLIISDINEAIKKPNQYFIELDNEKKLTQFENKLDFDYFNGAIVIKYFDQILMDLSLWDLVDQLWCYLIRVIEDVLQYGKGETFFPDQPVKIEINMISQDSILFSLDGGRILKTILPKAEFFNALLDGAEDFFTKITTYFSGSINYEYEINKIHLVRDQLNS